MSVIGLQAFGSMAGDSNTAKTASSRRHFDRWSAGYERDEAVLCTTSFHHSPDPKRAVAEMARVLVPGGRIVIADMVADRVIMRAFDRILRHTQRSHVGCQRSGDLVRLLRAGGFSQPTRRPLLRGFFAIVAARRADSTSDA